MRQFDQETAIGKPTRGIGWAFAFAIQVFLVFPFTLPAFDKPKAYIRHDPPRVAPALADVYDLLFFDKARPYWIRVRIRCDGKPFSAVWDRWLDDLFADLDVNGDGYLDAKECQRIPPARSVLQMMLNGSISYGIFPTPELHQLDEDHDRRISRHELAEYYLRGNVPLLRILPPYNPDPNARSINHAIFERLDTNKDGKLSRAEVRAAEKLLDQLDLDDDECLSALELAPQLHTAQSQHVPYVVPSINQFAIARPDWPWRGLAQRLLERYERDGDFHLDRNEIGLDEAAFAALDRDGNGKLDIPELTDFFQNGLPDLELRLTFGAGSALARLEEVASHRSSVRLRSIGPGRRVAYLGSLCLTLDDANVPAPAPQQFRRDDALRRFFSQAFMQAASGKTYITERDVEKAGNPQLRGMFRYADRDGDGKLTMQELAAFLELHLRAADVPLNVAMFSTSRNWFVDLDVNRDGRLSRKELQNAWERLTEGREPLDGLLDFPAGDDRLTLLFQRGTSVNTNVAVTYLTPRILPAPTRGPLWFRKMDRNGDGYVSRREFLGTKADFDRLDRNGDGLIDVEEAEAAGKK